MTGAIEKAGGCVVGSYKEPLDGHPVFISILPIDAVEPTPFQRNLSDAQQENELVISYSLLVFSFTNPHTIRTAIGDFYSGKWNFRLSDSQPADWVAPGAVRDSINSNSSDRS